MRDGGEENGEPEQAGAEFAGLFGGGIDGEAEEDENDEDEDDGGGEEFAGTELGAKLFAEEGGGVGEEAHGGGSGASEGEDGMERGAGVGVGDDGAGIELNGARGERGNFGFAVEAHDHGAAGTMDIAERFGEPGNAEGIEAGGGLVEEENAGAMNQCSGDGDALAHAAGKGADERSAALVEADFAEKFFGAGGGLRDAL